MVKTIRKIIRWLYPEIAGGYHLPMLGRIVSLSDAPLEGHYSDEFRPHFAADVQLLDIGGNDDTEVPVLQSLPLPLHGAGKLNATAVGLMNLSAKENIVVKGKKIYLGTDGQNVLRAISDLAGVVQQLESDLASHTHGNGNNGSPTTAPTNPAPFSNAGSNMPVVLSLRLMEFRFDCRGC